MTDITQPAINQLNQFEMIEEIMGPGKIEIKDTTVLRGLMERSFAPLLIDIQCWVADRYGILITETYRPERHQGDTHSTDPVRANDNRVWCYMPESLAYKIKDAINNRWEYDPDRPVKQCARIHDVGEGKHFHIQVHPNTRLR